MKEQESTIMKNPSEIKHTDHYKEQYIEDFVNKWDELIDWEARSKNEGDFFIQELKKRGAKKILDAATGTGFNSVQLMKQGFDVHSADGSQHMLNKAFDNAKKYGYVLRTILADWRWLNKDVDEKYDAVICLGNSFTHLFNENDRRKTLAEFYSVLKHDGVLILDQRNYDSMLKNGFSSKHKYYYAGKQVSAEPEKLDPDLARFKYTFSDGAVYHLNMYPLQREYTRRLLKEVGFQQVTTYGDFIKDFDPDEADFLLHIAEKKYPNET